jgi:uncharacterized protein (TIGR01777 family)
MKTMVIAGGSGFMGSALTQYFEGRDWKVWVLTRYPKKAQDIPWDGETSGAWSTCIEGADVLVNLAGKSVDCRYTAKNKQAIKDSRVKSTIILGQALQNLESPPKVWLNASSATTYIHAENLRMTESEGIIGDDFSMNICKSWEAAFFDSVNPKVRKIAMRTAIVLGKNGGALPMLRRVTTFGLGSPHGDGQQWVSWIHIHDFCRTVDFLIQNQDCAGPYNISSPNPVKNHALITHLRTKQRVPFALPQPVFLLEFGAWIIGTETELLLKSRNVYPQRLLDSGFKFSFPEIEAALSHL